MQRAEVLVIAHVGRHTEIEWDFGDLSSMQTDARTLVPARAAIEFASAGV